MNNMLELIKMCKLWNLYNNKFGIYWYWCWTLWFIMFWFPLWDLMLTLKMVLPDERVNGVSF